MNSTDRGKLLHFTHGISMSAVERKAKLTETSFQNLLLTHCGICRLVSRLFREVFAQHFLQLIHVDWFCQTIVHADGHASLNFDIS